MHNFVVIGKIVETIKGIERVSAYKLYEIRTKKSYLSTREDVAKAMKKGVDILGLKVQYMTNKDGQHVLVVKEDRVFGIKDVDIVNGKGEPINNSNKHVIFSVEGFGEFKQYKLVNSNGIESSLTEEGLKKLVGDGKTIGCSMRRGFLYISKHCKQSVQECSR